MAAILRFIYFVFPWRLRSAIAHSMAFLAFDVFRFRRQLMIKNTEIVFPSSPLDQRLTWIRTSLWVQASNVIEFFRLPLLNTTWLKDEVVFHGQEHLNLALQKNKGVLVLSLHMGNPDFATAGLGLAGYKVSLISKFFKNPILNRIWYKLRGAGGTEYIDPHGAKTAFAILKALKRNGLVIFVIDQFLGAPYGRPATFFGKECGTSIGLSVFYKKTESPIVPVWATTGKDGKTHIHCGPEVRFPFAVDQSEECTLRMTEHLNRILEMIIVSFPGQWMWLHNRWKRKS